MRPQLASSGRNQAEFAPHNNFNLRQHMTTVAVSLRNKLRNSVYPFLVRPSIERTRSHTVYFDSHPTTSNTRLKLSACKSFLVNYPDLWSVSLKDMDFEAEAERTTEREDCSTTARI